MIEWRFTEVVVVCTYIASGVEGCFCNRAIFLPSQTMARPGWLQQKQTGTRAGFYLEVPLGIRGKEDQSTFWHKVRGGRRYTLTTDPGSDMSSSPCLLRLELWFEGESKLILDLWFREWSVYMSDLRVWCLGGCHGNGCHLSPPLIDLSN